MQRKRDKLQSFYRLLFSGINKIFQKHKRHAFHLAAFLLKIRLRTNRILKIFRVPFKNLNESLIVSVEYQKDIVDHKLNKIQTLNLEDI